MNHNILIKKKKKKVKLRETIDLKSIDKENTCAWNRHSR